METIEKIEKNSTELIPITKPISLSKLSSGFLKRWIQSHYKRESRVISIFNFVEMIRLIFTICYQIRVIKMLTIVDDSDRLLIYFGSPFHFLGGNRFHNEFLFILWNINNILTHIFVIHSRTQQYEWLEIFAFLGGYTKFSNIGNIEN